MSLSETKPLPLKNGMLFIDNSSFERFTTCPRSYEYYAIDKREASESRTALHFGKAIHSALQIRYDLQELKPLYEIELLQKQTLIREFENIDYNENEFRTLDRALETIEKYNRHYPVESMNVHSVGGKKLVEVSFAEPLGTVDGIRVIWTGRLDVAFEHVGGETIVLMDHKTSSMLGSTYFSDFQNSSQMCGYLWALQTLTKKPCTRVIINVLVNRKATKTGTATEFVREELHIPTTNIQIWQENTLQVISDMIRCSTRSYFPQHTKACVGKYGKCEFFDVCTLPPDQRQTMLQSGLFKEVTFSPIREN